MVDSRQKGARAELQARDLLRKLSGLVWERVPMSGGLGAQHGLKGDLYVPKKNLGWCVEVKHYKEDQISTKLITGKNPKFNEWWAQTMREAEEIEKAPLLLFKHDRSKWFVAYRKMDVSISCIAESSPCKEFRIEPLGVTIALAEQKLKHCHNTIGIKTHSYSKRFKCIHDNDDITCLNNYNIIYTYTKQESF